MMRGAGTLALALAASLLGLAAPERAAAFAEFEIIVADDPGEGFNDPTTVTPIGGNTGTTLGEQRLQALRRAADLWAAALDSAVVIRIEATFDPIECVGGYSTTLALGGTTFLEFVIDEEGDEVLVPTALGDRIEGVDLEPGEADISIQFNSNVDSRTCLDGIGWYYGLDGNPGIDSDMIDTALHEIAHGLGMQSLHDAQTGTLLDGVPSTYLKRVLDLDAGKHWHEMSDAERLASQANARRVVWDGPRTNAQSAELLARGLPGVSSEQVPGLSGFYADAAFGAWTVATSVSGELAADTTGACPPLDVSGKIALMPWDCAHSSWVASVAAEGALAVLVENPADWELPVLPLDEPMPEPVSIPVIAISTADLGRFVDAATAGPVTVTLSIDEAEQLGADGDGRVMMNITAPQTASSIAHVEPLARPSLLMEPITAPRTLHELDITPAMLHDIGWTPFCGNGEINQEEECDDGPANDDMEPDACRTTCLDAACGDGVLDTGEACDDGADNSDSAADACRTTCERPRCGDGVTDDGEGCDDGADNSDSAADACRVTCQRPHCGDGVIDQGEACDDGAANAAGMPCGPACAITPDEPTVPDGGMLTGGTGGTFMNGGGAGGTVANEAEDDGGCGCRIAGRRKPATTVPLASSVAALALLGARARRRSRREAAR